jgi:DNA-binding beta-propeller fold protein YncE
LTGGRASGRRLLPVFRVSPLSGGSEPGSFAMTIKSMLAASAALLFTAAAAPAAEVAALWGDNTISIVDTSQKKVVKTWNISGINGKVLGIDVRPADGMLYAVAADGGVYTVDLKTGKATMKSKLETTLAAGSWATVDFNPAADRVSIQ